MKLADTPFICKVCGKPKKNMDHSKCSKKLQDMHKDVKRYPRVKRLKDTRYLEGIE